MLTRSITEVTQVIDLSVATLDVSSQEPNEPPVSACLTRDEIDSYAYLLATGAELPEDNAFNRITMAHLETCATCLSSAKEAFNEAVVAYASFVLGDKAVVTELLHTRLNEDEPLPIHQRRFSLYALAKNPGSGASREMTIEVLRNVVDSDSEQCVRSEAADILSTLLGKPVVV